MTLAFILLERCSVFIAKLNDSSIHFTGEMQCIYPEVQGTGDLLQTLICVAVVQVVIGHFLADFLLASK